MRHSLRSLEANVPHGRVIVLQDKPRWIRGVEYLPVTHGSMSRFDRVKDNLRALLAWPDCPDVFAFWNDDFYRMAPLEHYEAQDRGSAIEFGREMVATQPSIYHRSVADTADLLVERGYPEPLCYETHAPIVVHADTLRLTFEMFDGVDTLWQWRTAYGNVAGVHSSQVTDPKLGGKRDEVDPSWPWLSTSPLSWRGKAGRYVRAKFYEPSRYEAG